MLKKTGGGDYIRKHQSHCEEAAERDIRGTAGEMTLGTAFYRGTLRCSGLFGLLSMHVLLSFMWVQQLTEQKGGVQLSKEGEVINK